MQEGALAVTSILGSEKFGFEARGPAPALSGVQHAQSPGEDSWNGSSSGLFPG